MAARGLSRAIFRLRITIRDLLNPAEAPIGLGCSVDTLNKLCKDDAESLRMLREATVNPTGVHKGVDNVNTVERSSNAPRARGAGEYDWMRAQLDRQRPARAWSRR